MIYKKDLYGLRTNDDGSIGILYTTVDEEFVKRILLCEEINNVKLGSITNLTNPTDLNIQDIIIIISEAYPLKP